MLGSYFSFFLNTIFQELQFLLEIFLLLSFLVTQLSRINFTQFQEIIKKYEILLKNSHANENVKN